MLLDGHLILRKHFTEHERALLGYKGIRGIQSLPYLQIRCVTVPLCSNVPSEHSPLYQQGCT